EQRKSQIIWNFANGTQRVACRKRSYKPSLAGSVSMFTCTVLLRGSGLRVWLCPAESRAIRGRSPDQSFPPGETLPCAPEFAAAPRAVFQTLRDCILPIAGEEPSGRGPA